jgi:HNH endonuclease
MERYEMFLFEGRWLYTHQYMVNRAPHVCSIYNKKLPSKTHSIVHHKDDTKLNNDPANLQLVTRSEHSELHFRMTGRRPGTRLTPRSAFLASRITWG